MDTLAIADLIGLSARHLGLADYSPEQIEGALRGKQCGPFCSKVF